MRIVTNDLLKVCGCRSVGECTHNAFIERSAIDTLVDMFADAMKAKLHKSMYKGKSGWDDKNYTIEEIKQQLLAHVDKGDPVDVANFAAFWWNKT